MAINENVYGAENLWYDAFFQQLQLTNKNKIPYFDENKSSLIDGVNAGKLSFSEPIDKTISYCGLGTECALSHIAYTNFVNGSVEITDIQDRIVTNFGFFEKSNTTQYTPNASAFYYDNINWIKWGDYENLNNYQRLLSPLTLVNPHNIVLAINVTAYDSNMSNPITTSLYNYILYNTSTHPNIHRVTIQPFYGDISLMTQRDIYGGKGNVTNRISFQLGVLDEYRIPSKNVNFYSYGTTDFPVFGNVQNLPYTYNSTNVFGMVLHTENSLPHIKIVQGTNDISYVYTEYYPEFEQDIMKTVACFGLYFSPIVSIARAGSLTDNDMYIGLLDENGIGHGEYLRGSNTVNAPQNNYTDMSNSGYDYKKHDDNTKYSNGTSFNLWDFSLNCVNKFYVLTTAQVEQLSTELYTIMSSVSSDMPIERYNQTVFLTQNPIDCIVSIKRFPVDVPHLGTTTTVKLGSQSTSISAHYISKPCNVYYFTFSNSNNTGLYQTNGGSFLDYEPYTKVSINVPFCGSFDVPCNYFHKYGGVTVALLVDFVSGACTAFLMVNGNVVDSIQGECGVNVPLSGLQTATIDSQIFNAAMSKQKQDNNFALSMLGGAAAIGIGIATGGAAAVLGGAAAMVGGVLNKDINDKSIDYQLEHMQAPIKQVSSASPVIGRANDMRCKMIISRPEYVDGYNETVYANTIGFACLINGAVSDFTGLTIGDINVDGISATAEEKEMIKRKFATGVYL